MSADPVIELSISLQEMAVIIDEFLSEKSGERVSFVLIVANGGVAQYVSNTERKNGTNLIESLLSRWKAKRSDIPAHYNPDLPKRDAIKKSQSNN